MTSSRPLASEIGLLLTFDHDRLYKTERRLLVHFSEFVTYVIVKNDYRPFDGPVPYYLSRDCFHAYVSL